MKSQVNLTAFQQQSYRVTCWIPPLSFRKKWFDVEE